MHYTIFTFRFPLNQLDKTTQESCVRNFWVIIYFSLTESDLSFGELLKKYNFTWILSW